MYKNAFTCGIPHSDAVGNAYAAALGVVAGDAALGLEALAKVDDQANEAAKGLVEGGKVSVQVGEITPDIYIRAEVATASDCCAVTIAHTHTNIVNIVVNGDVVFQKDDEGQPGQEDVGGAPIHEYTLAELYNFIQSVPIEEISFIQQAYDMNLALFNEGLGHERTTFLKAADDLSQGFVGYERRPDDFRRRGDDGAAAVRRRYRGPRPGPGQAGHEHYGIRRPRDHLHDAFIRSLSGPRDFCRAAAAGDGAELFDYHVYQGIFRPLVGVLRLRYCCRHGHGLRPGLAEGRRFSRHGARCRRRSARYALLCRASASTPFTAYWVRRRRTRSATWAVLLRRVWSERSRR